MGDDGTITAFYLLEHTLEVLFGTKTVPVAKFRGTGRKDPCIPASYFAGDCLKDSGLRGTVDGNLCSGCARRSS